jgi:type I restriction-modification system DNA methylase subunit
MKQKSIKSIRQEFRKGGVFYTPPELAEKLKEYVDISVKTVYDPTCGAGILYRGQREGKIRQWFIENNYIDRVVNVPGNTFEDTAIATCLIVLRKNRTTTDIVIENDGMSRPVPLEEIAQNSYVLSPSTYVSQEPESVSIDPDQVKSDARKGFLENLRTTLDVEVLVSSLDGGSIQPFIDDIKKIVAEYDMQQEGE